jgi:hypothetical protein
MVNKDGVQNYPQCLNSNVTGSGTATPAGTLSMELYKDWIQLFMLISGMHLALISFPGLYHTLLVTVAVEATLLLL